MSQINVNSPTPVDEGGRATSAGAGMLAVVLAIVVAVVVVWLLFSGLFFRYQLGSIVNAFAVTAGAFLALSVYASVTKKDLSAWRTPG